MTGCYLKYSCIGKGGGGTEVKSGIHECEGKVGWKKTENQLRSRGRKKLLKKVFKFERWSGR